MRGICTGFFETDLNEESFLFFLYYNAFSLHSFWVKRCRSHQPYDGVYILAWNMHTVPGSWLHLPCLYILPCASWWNASWHISMQGFIVKKTPAHITILEILSSCCVLYLLAELHDSEYTVWVASMAATWPPRDDIIHAGLFSGYQKVNFISSLRPRRRHPQASSIPWWLSLPEDDAH